jgi:hypothetical protein
MKNEREKSSPSESPPSEPVILTADAVRKALNKAASNADELNEQLREVFALTDTSAALRLR